MIANHQKPLFAAGLELFARKYNLTSENQILILPALFERTAELVELPVLQLLDRANFKNPSLGVYLAGCAVTAAAKL